MSSLTRWEEGRSRWASSAFKGKDGQPQPDANGDRIRTIKAGETYTVAELNGPGIINHIWLTIYQSSFTANPRSLDTANINNLLLRIYWDGREKPDVEAPVGAFFASSFGLKTEIDSHPVIVEDGDAYNCYWQMPFHKSARIEIVNQSKRDVCKLFYCIDWVEKKSLPENTMNFCAQYRQEYPVVNDPNTTDNEYLILDAEGKGYYVGTVLAVRTRSPDWFGEGDMRIRINGEERPSLWGTGTEDYFLSAWGFKKVSMPYFGVSYLNHRRRDLGQKSSSYRWHLHDPIVFSESIKVAIETMGWLNADENPEGRSRTYGIRNDDYSSVAYWYQMGPSKKFTETPHARERKLPNIERVQVFGKDHASEKFHGEGKTQILTLGRFRDENSLFRFTPATQEEGWMEMPFTIEEHEPLRLILVLESSPKGGIYQLYLDDVKLGKPIDLYAEDHAVVDHHIMDFWPEVGDHTVRLVCVGKNRLAKDMRLGVNSICLRERLPNVKKYGYIKDRDWRKEQYLFYRGVTKKKLKKEKK